MKGKTVLLCLLGNYLNYMQYVLNSFQQVTQKEIYLALRFKNICYKHTETNKYFVLCYPLMVERLLLIGWQIFQAFLWSHVATLFMIIIKFAHVKPSEECIYNFYRDYNIYRKLFEYKNAYDKWFKGL